MRKIGILGGSFDPIHVGHLHAAKTALKALNLDEVWFMPTISTPLKANQLTDVKHRAAMIKRMIKPYRKFKLSMLEEKNTIPSYTINTARLLKKMYPDDKFYWIIGSDWVKGLNRWKDIEELKTLLTFVCISRDENESDEVLMIKANNHPASSTAIRNGNFRYVPYWQRKYFMENNLYIETIAHSLVNESRWPHIVSMTDTAVDIAVSNGIEPYKAFLAGMFHDCTKKLTEAESSALMAIFAQKQEKEQNSNCWHAPTGYYFAHKYLAITDKDVLKAIRHHCIGDDDSDLSMVIYLADKLDPIRGYDSSKEIALAKQDLKKAFEVVHKQQNEYLVKTGVL